MGEGPAPPGAQNTIGGLADWGGFLPLHIYAPTHLFYLCLSAGTGGSRGGLQKNLNNGAYRDVEISKKKS